MASTAADSAHGRNLSNIHTAGAASERGAVRRNSNAIRSTGVMSLGLNSPKASNFESMPAFKIDTSKRIPGKQDLRTRQASDDRMGSLMRMPNHKSGTSKFDPTMHVKTL